MEINHRTDETNEKILILVFGIKDISMWFIHEKKQKQTPELKWWLQVYLTKALNVLTRVFSSLEAKSYFIGNENSIILDRGRGLDRSLK